MRYRPMFNQKTHELDLDHPKVARLTLEKKRIQDARAVEPQREGSYVPDVPAVFRGMKYRYENGAFVAN